MVDTTVKISPLHAVGVATRRRFATNVSPAISARAPVRFSVLKVTEGSPPTIPLRVTAYISNFGAGVGEAVNADAENPAPVVPALKTCQRYPAASCTML